MDLYTADESDYEILRDRIIDLFNPPDDDIAEPAVMIAAIERAATFIESLDCYCEPQAATYDDDPCGRCAALGRIADVRAER